MRNAVVGRRHTAYGGICALVGTLYALYCLPSTVFAARLHTSGGETNNGTVTEWNGATNATFSTSTVHSGAYSIQFNLTSATGNVQRALASSKTSGTLYARVYARWSSLPSANAPSLITFGTTESLNLRVVASTSKVRLRNAITGTSVDSTMTLSTGTWYRFEVKDVLADTGGSLEARIFADMETNPLETLNINNEDTLPSSVASIYFGSLSDNSTVNVFIDDIALNDESGTFENGYPGPGKIALLKPASNDTVTWTKTGANCSGTTNADCVDDEPGTPDDASGYNTSSTANNEDRLNSTSLPAEVPSDADMVLLEVHDRWDGNGTTGTRQGRHLIWDEASAQTNGPTHSRCDVAAGNWSIASTSQITVFYLGARTKANVESFDLGYEPLNSAECRVTAIWANVEWAPAAAGPAVLRRVVRW